jgi:hypothetical protein
VETAPRRRLASLNSRLEQLRRERNGRTDVVTNLFCGAPPEPNLHSQRGGGTQELLASDLNRRCGHTDSLHELGVPFIRARALIPERLRPSGCDIALIADSVTREAVIGIAASDRYRPGGKRRRAERIKRYPPPRPRPPCHYLGVSGNGAPVRPTLVG